MRCGHDGSPKRSPISDLFKQGVGMAGIGLRERYFDFAPLLGLEIELAGGADESRTPSFPHLRIGVDAIEHLQVHQGLYESCGHVGIIQQGP